MTARKKAPPLPPSMSLPCGQHPDIGNEPDAHGCIRLSRELFELVEEIHLGMQKATLSMLPFDAPQGIVDEVFDARRNTALLILILVQRAHLHLFASNEAKFRQCHADGYWSGRHMRSVERDIRKRMTAAKRKGS